MGDGCERSGHVSATSSLTDGRTRITFLSCRGGTEVPVLQMIDFTDYYRLGYVGA